MLGDLNLALILGAALIASVSPGPATLAIANTSMAAGTRRGLAIAAGITCGSLTWSISAAVGLAAVLQSNAWVLEGVRYGGAAYLLYLGYKAAKSALVAVPLQKQSFKPASSPRSAFLKGLLLHLTNPKAILFFGSLYAIGVPSGTPISAIAIMIAAIGVQSFVIFHGYAFLFSRPAMVRAYEGAKRWFEAAFALAFAYAGFKILFAPLS